MNVFGYEVQYEVVKQRLLDEFSHRKAHGSNEIRKHISATRQRDESWTCFSIRLTTQATKVDSTAEGSREIMVRSTFL